MPSPIYVQFVIHILSNYLNLGLRIFENVVLQRILTNEIYKIPPSPEYYTWFRHCYFEPTNQFFNTRTWINKWENVYLLDWFTVPSSLSITLIFWEWLREGVRYTSHQLKFRCYGAPQTPSIIYKQLNLAKLFEWFINFKKMYFFR